LFVIREPSGDASLGAQDVGDGEWHSPSVARGGSSVESVSIDE
jgi:hypothetical protein